MIDTPIVAARGVTRHNFKRTLLLRTMAAWGRRKAGTEVYLNVYDLSSSNNYLHRASAAVPEHYLHVG